jgi:hypothetical protein
VWKSIVVDRDDCRLLWCGRASALFGIVLFMRGGLRFRFIVTQCTALYLIHPLSISVVVMIDYV